MAEDDEMKKYWQHFQKTLLGRTLSLESGCSAVVMAVHAKNVIPTMDWAVSRQAPPAARDRTRWNSGEKVLGLDLLLKIQDKGTLRAWLAVNDFRLQFYDIEKAREIFGAYDQIFSFSNTPGIVHVESIN